MSNNRDISAGGVKYDTGKLRFDLLPPQPLAAVAAVFSMGAEKYAPRNWEEGMDWGRVFAASQRHIHAFWAGEIYDPESGIHHLAHATFGMLVLMEYQRLGAGCDDRKHLTRSDELLVMPASKS